MAVDMSRATLGGTSTLPNPMMTASGCAANGQELHRFFDVSELGAFVTKSVMADPRSGRGTPRMAETPVGDAQLDRPPGAGHRRVRRQGPRLAQVGRRPRPRLDRRQHQRRVRRRGRRRSRPAPAFDAVVGVEVNISCPNVANRGLVFACDPLASRQGRRRSCASSCRRDVPVFAKLTPDVTDIVSDRRRPA